MASVLILTLRLGTPPAGPGIVLTEDDDATVLTEDDDATILTE